MKCMSCGAPILPEFKAAITQNICPGCGGELLNEATIELLDELKAAFEKMPNDPEGLSGWLLSNYEMRKIGTAEPVQQFYGSQMPYYPQPGYQQQPIYRQQNPELAEKEAALRANPKYATNKLETFYQNAGVKPKTKAHYSALAQQIQDGNVGPDYGNLPSPQMNPVLAQQMALTGELPMGYPPPGYPPPGYPPPGYHPGYQPQPGYPPQPYGYPPQQGYPQQRGYPPQQGYPQQQGYDSDYVEEALDPEFTQAALSAMNGTEKPMNREEMRAMQAAMRNAGGGDINFGEDPNTHPAVQMLRMDKLRKQQELSDTGKIGKISRSG